MDVLKYVNEINKIDNYPELKRLVGKQNKKTILYNIKNGYLIFTRCPVNYGIALNTGCNSPCKKCWIDALSKLNDW